MSPALDLRKIFYYSNQMLITPWHNEIKVPDRVQLTGPDYQEELPHQIQEDHNKIQQKA